MALGTALPAYSRPRSEAAGAGTPGPAVGPIPGVGGYRGSGSSAGEYSGGPVAPRAQRGSTPGGGYQGRPSTGGGSGDMSGSYPNRSNGYGAIPSALNYYAAQNGPAFAQLGVNDAGYYAQAAQANGAYGLAQRYGQQDLGFGNRQYGLDMAGLQGQQADAGLALGYGNARLDIDQGAAGRQIDYLNTLMGWNTEDLGARLGFIDQYQGLAEQSAGRQQGYIGEQRGFNERGYVLDVGNINNNTDTDLRRQRDAAAASGATSTLGNRAGTQDIFDTQGYQLNKAELSFDDVLAGLNNQSASVREQLASQLLGFEEGRYDLNSGYRRDQLGLSNDIAGQNDVLANIGISREELGSGYNSTMRDLGIRGQEIGLNQEQMASSIQRQLEAANLDRVLSVADVMGGLASNDIQRQQLMEQIIRQATANAGAFNRPRR